MSKSMSDEEFEMFRQAQGIKNEGLAAAVISASNAMTKEEFENLLRKGLRLEDLEREAREYIAKKNYKGPRKKLDI